MRPAARILLLVLALTLLGVGIRTLRTPPPLHQGRTIDAWLRDLAHPDSLVRSTARDMLLESGANAVPSLLRGLRLRDSPIRPLLARAHTLWPALPLPPPASAPLRERSAEILGALTIHNPDHLHRIVLALADPSPVTRAELERTLRRARTSAVPPLSRGLAATDPSVRAGACRVLRDLGPLAQPARKALDRALRDPHPPVREQAALALGHLDLPQPAATLFAALADPAPRVRAAAATALANSQPTPHSSRSLTGLLADPNPRVRVAAARGLVRWNAPLSPSLRALISALDDREAGWEAAFTLGDLGPAAADAVPGLIEALKRERSPRPLRESPSTAFALGKIGPAAVAPLIPLLANPEPRVRTSAAIALAYIGADSRAAVPALLHCLRHDPDPEVRQASALALGDAGPEIPELKLALLKMVHDDDIYIANAAATVLRKIDPEAATLVGPE